MAVLFVGAAVVGSLLPDADDSGSRIHKQTHIEKTYLLAGAAGTIVRIPIMLVALLPHRGITHWLPIAAIPAVGVWLLVPVLGWAVALGYVLHLWADGCTPYGIPGWPFRHKIWFLPYWARIETGAMGEALFAGLWVIMSAVVMILLIG